MTHSSLVVLAVALSLVGAGCRSRKAKPDAAGAPVAQIPKPPKPVDKRDYGHHACRLMKPCYMKFNAFGQVGGKILVKINDQGAAVTTTFEGKAPAPVKDCIVQRGKAIVVPQLRGSPGTLSCSYSGTLMQGGMEMMSTSWGFAEEKKAAAPAKAP
jgi:hypothetical protein